MTDTESLAAELSDLFQENVAVEDVKQRELGGAKIAVATISYNTTNHSTSGPSTRTHYEQTAVILDDDQLHVPQFSLSPQAKGLLRTMIKFVGDFGAIEFSDSPEFSEHYLLHGWSQEPVRVLFTKAIRDHFAGHPGWSVRGKKSRLVIYKANEVCSDDEVDGFVQQALEILALFQEGEEQLDARPDIHRDVRPQDVAQTASEMGGMIGAMMQKQLAKISVTPDQLESFVASRPPRQIPPGMKRQVVGDNLPLVFIGMLFVAAGLFGGVVWMILADGFFKLLGLPFLLFVPVIGGLMSVLTLRHRKRKLRTLRDGRLGEGVVTKVSQTSVSVDSQRRYEVTIEYELNGTSQTTTSNAYGTAVDQARALKDSGDPTRILIDPEDDSHVVSLDLLMVFG